MSVWDWDSEVDRDGEACDDELGRGLGGRPGKGLDPLALGTRGTLGNVLDGCVLDPDGRATGGDADADAPGGLGSGRRAGGVGVALGGTSLGAWGSGSGGGTGSGSGE